MVTPQAKRACCQAMVEAHGCSERRACQLVGANRASIRYESHKPEEGLLRGRITTIAHEKRRYGYRRIHVLLKREGIAVNHKVLIAPLTERLRMRWLRRKRN